MSKSNCCSAGNGYSREPSWKTTAMAMPLRIYNLVTFVTGVDEKKIIQHTACSRDGIKNNFSNRCKTHVLNVFT